VLLLAAPVLLASRKRRAGLLQKLGFVPEEARRTAERNRGASTSGKTVWFHAVSVGEFYGALPLILDFHKRNPGHTIFVSTTTETGQKLVQEKLKGIATVFYFPLDLPFAIRNWLDAIEPDAVVIVETELWPGFTHECVARNIKLALVNARMSP